MGQHADAAGSGGHKVDLGAETPRTNTFGGGSLEYPRASEAVAAQPVALSLPVGSVEAPRAVGGARGLNREGWLVHWC